MSVPRKNSYPEVFDRLEQAFGVWEEEMWTQKIWRQRGELLHGSSNASLVGYPVDNCEQTRELLMHAATQPDCEYLLPEIRSVGYPERPCDIAEEIELMKQTGLHTEKMIAFDSWYPFHFPYYLGLWNSDSRRIFYIPEDLVLMLQTTSLRGHTFDDIRYPFPSFGLALEKPIISDTGEEMDFFLLCGEDTPQAFYSFSRKLRNFRPTEAAVKNKIAAAYQKRNFERFKSLTYKPLGQGDRFMKNWRGEAWLDAGEGDPSVDIEDDFRQATKDENKGDGLDWAMKAVRLIIGFCFYLQAFHETRKDLVSPRPTNLSDVRHNRGSGESLTSTADIFEVQSIFELSSEEKRGFSDFLQGAGGWEVNTHFREGHWRRPAGQGCNPLAEKTIWVRPTMVRRDRLAEGTLPHSTGVLTS